MSCRSGMALFVVTLGVGMAIKTQQPLVVIASIALGSLIGELMDLEGALEAASMKLENRIGDSAKGFSTGFITTSLIYCTGSMAVLGAFEEGSADTPRCSSQRGSSTASPPWQWRPRSALA